MAPLVIGTISPVPSITTAEEARTAFGPEVRGPNREAMNVTAATVDALEAFRSRLAALQVDGTAGMLPRTAKIEVR